MPHFFSHPTHLCFYITIPIFLLRVLSSSLMAVCIVICLICITFRFYALVYFISSACPYRAQLLTVVDAIWEWEGFIQRILDVDGSLDSYQAFATFNRVSPANLYNTNHHFLFDFAVRVHARQSQAAKPYELFPKMTSIVHWVPWSTWIFPPRW